MNILLNLATFLFGLFIGSFLNVVSIRSYEGRSWWSGRSACTHCKKTIAWHDNIPVVSFIFLRGQCRNCKTAISYQYPLVELITGILFVLLFVHYGIGARLMAYAILTCFLIVIFLQDLRHTAVLDQISIPAALFIFILNVWFGMSVVSLIFGVALGAGFFALQYLVSRGTWVGDGDIRLGALMGAALGWQYTIVALMIAYMTGAMVGVILLLQKKKEMSSAVPFGPFLMLATFVTLLYGPIILQKYLQLLYQ